MFVEKVRGALRIRHVDARAARSGLKRGLALADARACFPRLAVVDADDHADRRFLVRLAVWCDRFTPMVALDEPDGLILDLTGCAHLFGGEAALRARLLGDLRGSPRARMPSPHGLHVRASIAGTPDAARALARFSDVAIVPPGEDEAATRPLPLAAIQGIDGDTVTALSRAGLKTLGAVADRPMAALAARFGDGLVTGLMRTLGRQNVRITPLRPLPPAVAERQFAGPLMQTDVLEGVLAALVTEVVGILQERGEGGRAFEARLFRSDGAVRRLVVETGRPCREAATIVKLYRERLHSLAEPIDAGFGFDAVRLCVARTEAFSLVQASLDGHAQDDDDIAHLVDRLTVRFGRARVLRFEACGTHIPELAARLVPAADIAVKDAARAGVRAAPSWPRRDPGEPPLRPLHLFEPPQLVEALAEVPDGPPRRFRWRRVLHDVVHAEGPERIAPEWWSGEGRLEAGCASARDYYRVEDKAGGRFWMFRQGRYGEAAAPPRWFLHGVFA